MKKCKLLSIIISAVMVIAMLPTMAFADTNELDVECQADLERMTLDGTYTITDDFTIDAATFNPVDNFIGKLNGDGHTITWTTSSPRVLTDSYFGIVKTNSGDIYDLNVTGVLTVSGNSNIDYVSPVAAYNSGTITGVESKTEVSAGGFYNVGGIAGYNKGIISLCRNIKPIKAMKKVGGITGENAGTIERCYNVGDITGTDGSKNGVGGIAGRAGDNNEPTETSIIENCFNWGNISCPDGKWVGGICGFENSLSSCTNCYNAGNISGVSYLDHIAGKIEGKVTNCYGLDSVHGPEGYDKATPVSQNALEGRETVGKTGKNIVDLINDGGSAWGQQNHAYPYIVDNSMSSVYSFTFTGPTQTEYEVDSTFNPDGLIIKATSLSGGTTILEPGEYHIVNGSGLMASQKSVTAKGTYNGFEFSIEIPIKVHGRDEVTVGTGGTFNELGAALKHVNEDGRVIVLSPITYSPTEDVTFNINATICKGAEFTNPTDPMITIAADTNMVTLTTMTIDGSYTSGSNADTLIKVTSGTLRLRGNATLKNCNIAVDVAAASGKTAELVVNRADITGSVNSIKLENTSSLFTFENYTKPAGKPSSNISGNVYLATDTYITIGAALPCNIALSMQTATVGKVVAKGTSEYKLADTDKSKLSVTSGNSLKLDTTKNEISISS